MLLQFLFSLASYQSPVDLQYTITFVEAIALQCPLDIEARLIGPLLCGPATCGGMYRMETQRDTRADDVVESLRLWLRLLQTCLQCTSLLHYRQHLQLLAAQRILQFRLANAYVNVAKREREISWLELQGFLFTYSVISSFSNALFRFLIFIRLFSASALRRFSFCSAAGFSDSSSGGPLGRGSLPRHSCMRRFCMTASRSCRAERSSFDSLRVEREESVPPREPPLRRRPVVDVQCEAPLFSCSCVSCAFSDPE